VSTTTRLNALFTMTACSAAKPRTPISKGSRYSAPPRPSIPPSSPTALPAAKANSKPHSGEASRSRCCLSCGHATSHGAVPSTSRTADPTARPRLA
jgi:hypothetical protein